jgi:hypothetical protein
VTAEVYFEFWVQKHYTDKQLRMASLAVFGTMITFDEKEVKEYAKTFIDADRWEIWIDEIHSSKRTAMIKESMVSIRSLVRAHLIKKE